MSCITQSFYLPFQSGISLAVREQALWVIWTITHQSEILEHTHFWESVHTYSDEGLVEAVEAKVPDEPAAAERRNVPEVEVRDHQERSAPHHPVEK